MENVYFACFLSVGNKLPVFPTVRFSEDLVISLDQFCAWREVGSLAFTTVQSRNSGMLFHLVS